MAAAITLKRGHKGNLSPEQQSKLDQARGQLADDESNKADDHMVLRYLRARNWDCDAGLAALRKTLAWREEYKADTILEETPEAVEKIKYLFTHGPHKLDKNGHPVYITRTGELAASGVRNILSDDELRQVQTYNMEIQMKRCREASEKFGKHIESITTIMDLKGITMRARNSISMLKITSEINVSHYPESLENMIIINAPWVFPFLYNIVKKFLDPAVRKKIRVYRNAAKKELLGIIDAENLPKSYGGTCECEGGCLIVPKEEIKEMEDEAPDDLRKVDLAPGEIHEEILVAGKVSETVFGWYFNSTSDVDFSVEWHPAEQEDHVMVREVERVRSDKVAISGSYTVFGEGFVKFVWSNSFSKIKAKTIHLSVYETKIDEE